MSGTTPPALSKIGAREAIGHTTPTWEASLTFYFPDIAAVAGAFRGHGEGGLEALQ